MVSKLQVKYGYMGEKNYTLIIRQHHIFIIGHRQLLLVLMLMLVPMLHHPHLLFLCHLCLLVFMLMEVPLILVHITRIIKLKELVNR